MGGGRVRGERRTYQQKPTLYAIHIAQTCVPSAQTSRNTGKERMIFSDAKQIRKQASATQKNKTKNP